MSCSLGSMLFTTLKAGPLYFRPRQLKHSNQKPPNHGRAFSSEATAEINAYIAVRDMYLKEAEDKTTTASLQRAELANELVAQSLKPARSPYEAQCLSEDDAMRERQRCALASSRLAALRNRLQGSPQAVQSHAA